MKIDKRIDYLKKRIRENEMQINTHIKILEKRKKEFTADLQSQIDFAKKLKEKVPDVTMDNNFFYSKKTIPNLIEVQMNYHGVTVSTYRKVVIDKKTYKIYKHANRQICYCNYDYATRTNKNWRFVKVSYKDYELVEAKFKKALMKMYLDDNSVPVKNSHFAPEFFQKLYNFS